MVQPVFPPPSKYRTVIRSLTRDTYPFLVIASLFMITWITTVRPSSFCILLPFCGLRMRGHWFVSFLRSGRIRANNVLLESGFLNAVLWEDSLNSSSREKGPHFFSGALAVEEKGWTTR